MHTKNKSTSHDAYVQVYLSTSSKHSPYLKENVLQNKTKCQKNHILCTTNTYILYKYIHKYTLHTTAINLKSGIYRGEGSGGVGW